MMAVQSIHIGKERALTDTMAELYLFVRRRRSPEVARKTPSWTILP